MNPASHPCLPIARFGCLLALCVFCFGPAWGQAAASARAPLRVVTDNNYPPYAFIGPDGHAEGYLVDLWQLWQQKTGTPVELQPMEWSQAQRRLLDGQADVIDLIYRTPARERLYDFSEPYASLPVGIYVDASIQGIRNARAMSGFVVGVQRGDACVDELVRQGVQRLSVYPNYSAILQAAKAGEIKMFCMDDEPANYYLYFHRDSLRFAKAFTLYEGHPHWAVAHGRQAVFEQVRQGMGLITEAEREALRQKWTSRPLQFKPYLQMTAVVLGGMLLALAGASLWIWTLRRLVRARTAELRQKNHALEIASNQLQIEQAQLRTIVDSTPEAIALKDLNGVYVDCNPGLQALMRLPRDQIIGRTDEQIIRDRGLVARVQAQDRAVQSAGVAQTSELRFPAPGGGMRQFEMTKVPIRSQDGALSRVLTSLRDITESRRTERELRISSVAFESQDGMLITDPAGRIERVNVAFTRITGYGAQEVMGRTPALLKSGLHDQAFYDGMWAQLHSSGYWIGEVMNRHRQGRLYTVRLAVTAITDSQGEVLHFIGHFQDLSAVKQAQALAQRLELFDPLTDLPNRTLLGELMARALEQAAQDRHTGAVIMLDLDRFQQVNDSQGHAVGDQLLLEVARRIQALMPEGGILSRFSGDSFVLVLGRLGPDPQIAENTLFTLAETLRCRIADPVQLTHHRVITSASLGATFFQGQGVAPDVLLRQAELAMYRSKQSGRNTVRVFEEAMQAELHRKTWLEEELRNAIGSDQLTLHYQLQVDATGQAIGAEALIRWNHPTRGMIAPSEFIGLAEESGLIEPIGQWVIDKACRQLAGWATDARLSQLSLAVNVSPRQFKSERFVDGILEAIARTGASPHKLKIEVTESLAIDDFEAAIAKLHQLRRRGFCLSLDDFGTGNSSLNYLTQLPLSQLKIDKSFIDRLAEDERNAMVVQTIVAMGLGLGLDVIAEGVETVAQQQSLQKLGCLTYQGYLYGRPLPIEDFERSLRREAVTDRSA